MALIVKLTCLVRVEKEGWPSDTHTVYGGDVSLAVAARVFPAELPHGMSYAERTASIHGFRAEPDGRMSGER